MSKEIPLTQEKVAIVDDIDYEWLNQWKWQYNERGYAQRTVYIMGTGKRWTLAMHNALMSPPKDMEIDHINHNGLDNRKNNLRYVTHQQNLINRRKFSGEHHSKYKGLVQRENNWMVQIKVNGNIRTFGTYSNEESAANAYNYYAKSCFGEFACLNEVKYIRNWRDYFVGRRKTSGFRGVSYVADTDRWICRTPGENNKYHHHGIYNTELEAARAYDEEVIRIFGIYDPRLNFPATENDVKSDALASAINQ